MRLCRATVIAVALLCCAGIHAAELRTGRMDVLLDVHAFNRDGCVVAPLAPLVHWLGATVQESRDWTVIVRGERALYLQFSSERPDAKGALVSVRTVVEALGAEVRYHHFDADEGAALGHISHVELVDGERVGRVLIHAAPPEVVTAILRDIDTEGHGTGWLLQVTALHGDWAKTHEPQWDEQHGFSQRYLTGVLHREDEAWRYALRSTKVSHSPQELEEAGISLDVAEALRMELEAQ
ncbi:MAG: hypothetical protein ACP5KN_13615 [Armatimonadota bacterium]